ncbi:YrdC domain-containing protein, mitochondrial [Aphelenchoides besseyi]|nr:YrdC domain-containing protein, mitochondrial [Aphelenchoides besseyi]KAI6225766.1 YrdC domain-containing protein, mitochondrial [Aphelenchoides besseyi]
MLRRMFVPIEKTLINTVNVPKPALNHVTDETKLLDLCSIDLSTAVQQTSEVLAKGGCVAVPTDTVYGLVTSSRFLHKLYDVKKRDHTKPVGLFVHSPSVIRHYADISVNDELLNKLLPGKVTLLFRRLAIEVTDNRTELIGFRIPDDEFVRQLCCRCDEPLAQTSANISGRPSAISPEEFVELWDSIDLIVVNSKREMDQRRQGSTIIDLSVDGFYKIRRDGCSLGFYESILRSYGLTRI